MNSRKIIASIFISVMSAVLLANGAVSAHHPAEPCSTDSTVIAAGSLPACSESPEFGAQDESSVAYDKEKAVSGNTSVFAIAGVGTVLFVVCILFLRGFSLNYKRKHETKQKTQS